MLIMTTAQKVVSTGGSPVAVEGRRVSKSECPLNSVVELYNMKVGLEAAIL